jgi:hypothetical protein
MALTNEQLNKIRLNTGLDRMQERGKKNALQFSESDRMQRLNNLVLNKKLPNQQTTQTPEIMSKQDVLPSDSGDSNAWGAIKETGRFFGQDILGGIAKGVGKSLAGMSEIGEKYLLNPVEKFITGETPQITGIESLGIDKYLEAKTPGQRGAIGAEQLAEFFYTGKAVSVAQKAFKSKDILTKAPKLKKLSDITFKAITEGLSAGTVEAIQEGDFDNNVKTAIIAGALFPVLAEPASKVASGIYTKLIKPSEKLLGEGFNVANISKYSLGGKNLQEMSIKTNKLINKYTDDLEKVLKKSGGADALLTGQYSDLNKLIKTTEESLTKNKITNFGDIKAIKRVINNLKEEIAETSESGLVDLYSATLIKRGAGNKGAWAYGRVEPDATAVEKVYTKFYNVIKKDIENKGGSEIKAINKKLSDLIPINRALIKRIPVAERNEFISLTDNILGFGVFMDPKVSALLIAKKGLRWMPTANFLQKVADSVSTRLSSVGVIGGAVKKVKSILED